MKKRLIPICIFTLLLLADAGCNLIETGCSFKALTIRPVVSSVFETKSGAAGEQIFDSFVVDTIGGQEIRLDAYVSDFNPEACGEETKGAITTTANITEFWMNAYAHDAWHDNGTDIDHIAGQYFDAVKTVTKNTTSGEWSIADSPKWPNDVDMSFWSWSVPISSSAVPSDIDLSNNKATISYSNNGAYDLIYAFNKEKRIFNKNTGEITGGTGTYKTGSKDRMDITFYHALSAIRFDISGLKNNGLTIKKIKIKNVVQKATCVITAPATPGDPLDFAWTPENVSNNIISLATDFSADDFTATGVDGTTSNALMPMSSDKFFFLIPQEVQGKGITIELVYEDASGTDVTKTASLNHSTEWEAGKYYTYKLTSDDADYFFSLSPESSSSTPVTVTTVSYTSQTSDNSHDIQIYSQKNSSSSDWDIKSYQVGNNTEVELPESSTSFNAGGLVVSEDTSEGQKKLTIKATKWTKQSVGTNSYWQNAGGTRTTDLGWSPESWSSKGVIDLSKLDYTEQTAYSTSNTMRTANCYIIRHAGTYKFPLVYGNAVDGSYAYNPTLSGSYTSQGLTPFKNHLDNNITSPFIENHSGCTAAGTPVVVWSDQANIITNLSIEGNTQSTGNYNAGNVRYVQFTITQDKICQNNAVIAIKDGTGANAKTIWSWHIWTTNDPALLKSGIPVTNYSGTEFDFFPLNCLGWTDAGSYPGREDVKITLVQKGSNEEITVTVTQPKSLEDDYSTGVHYQWGRKDPMPAKSGTVSGFDKSIITSGVSLGKAIQNPGIFYIKASSNWCSAKYYNLWSGGLCILVDQGLGSDTTTKTVYDPSPVGYKVPSISAFSGFSKDGKSHDTAGYFNAKGSYSNGLYFYTCKSGSVKSDTPTIFFPGAGWRDNRTDATNAGKLFMGDDYDGNYHSAYMWYSDPKMCYFAFSTGNILLTNNQYPTLGCSVRPVKE